VPVLSIQLLGFFQVSLSDEPLTGFESDKARALMAFLASEPEQAHRRERLAGLLWPGSPEGTARRNLRHTLFNLRCLLGDDTTSRAPYFLITRHSIRFDPTAGAWVDVLSFLSLLDANHPAKHPTIQHLVQAVDLYRGSFLEGFSIADSPEFEEWALLTRERLHRLAIDALHKLAYHYLQRGEYERALPYAWRQVELDPWREEAHQLVMRLLAFGGRRGAALAQYDTCRRVLAKELQVVPTNDTNELYQQIRDGTLEPPILYQAALPAFLDAKANDRPIPTFVAREPQLARLDSYLEGALAGKGQVVFVTGGPGRGKTALLGEFTRRAMAAHPELLVAMGRFNSLAGGGDSYLAFREILTMLTGDVETRWASGNISLDHARRLWAALPVAAQALAERGSHITNILVDGPMLVERVELATGSTPQPWLEQLIEHVERQKARSHGIEQSHLFGQVTNVLCRMANSHPLLLLVDDLQWADAASTELLFHLGRRIPGHRILIAVAYRPEEVEFIREGTRTALKQVQPLAKVLAEFKHQFGDVWIDLSHLDPDQDRTFVDAYLDTEPNRLGEGFRQALFERTAGHPLFTIELLREMQEEQALQLNDEHRWVEGSALHWETLPARVEGTIAQRIRRLEPELYRILTAACVEGEVFTAQVIARMEGSPEQQVMRRLSEDLERRHRLIKVQDEVRVGAHHLSRYRFSHVLFRDYLYNNLSPGERRLLHRQVGTALEQLYGKQVREIAAFLAHHFSGESEKERYYTRLAGERAVAQYAHDEAVQHLSRALELTPEDDRHERFSLLLVREQVYDRQGNRDSQRQDLAALEELAMALADPQKRAEVALRQASYAFFSADSARCQFFAQAAEGLARSLGNPELEAQAHRLWAMALFYPGQHNEARNKLERGLALARSAGARWLEAEILRQLSWTHHFLENYDQAEACLQAALSIFQDVGDQHDLMRVQYSLGAFDKNRFEYEQAKEHFEEGLRLSQELGDQHLEVTLCYALTDLFEVCGQSATARDRYRSVLSLTRKISARGLEARALLGLGSTFYALGESEEALPYIEKSLALAQEISERYVQAFALKALGHVLADISKHDQARLAYQQSLELRLAMGHATEAIETQAGLARLCLLEGDLDQAIDYVEDILRHLEIGKLEGTEQPLLVYLTCYRVLQAGKDHRADAVLKEGYRFMLKVAEKFSDEKLRRSYLENVAAHRELTREFCHLCPGEDANHGP